MTTEQQRTKPGFLPPYRRSLLGVTVRVGEPSRASILEGARSTVEVRRPRLFRAPWTGRFMIPPPADLRDGFDAPRVDQELAARGWRRTTEWDWPESEGAYVASIERTKR